MKRPLRTAAASAAALLLLLAACGHSLRRPPLRIAHR